MSKKIGKITSISLGLGGYQGSMLGLTVSFQAGVYSVGDFKGAWGPEIKWSNDCRWTEEDRRSTYADVMTFIGTLLVDAKKTNLADLKNVPVELTFEGDGLGGKLISWRILTEVI